MVVLLIVRDCEDDLDVGIEALNVDAGSRRRSRSGRYVPAARDAVCGAGLAAAIGVGDALVERARHRPSVDARVTGTPLRGGPGRCRECVWRFP